MKKFIISENDLKQIPSQLKPEPSNSEKAYVILLKEKEISYRKLARLLDINPSNGAFATILIKLKKLELAENGECPFCEIGKTIKLKEQKTKKKK